ncbi:flavin reductase (NADPH)-like [Mytilus galloprovincialis]|uniref:flavin reductase (NADPH)-like n=1 Tax=Mytilus galloprovincialis TaxID=29158 RepID=UPI003F7C6D60
MKIAVLGATGPTGLQFVLEALKNEHEIFALVRNPEGLSSVTNDKLKVKEVDILKEDDLVETFKNTDAVVSCLGCRPSFLGWSPITFYLDSIKPIVNAMRTANKKRLICMSSWGTISTPEEPRIIKYFLRPIFLSSTLKSMSEMEDYLKESCSDIDYTVVRPPGLTNDPTSGKEIKAEEGQCIPDIVGRIPRRDVAKFMLECAISHDWNKKCVAIGLET